MSHPRFEAVLRRLDGRIDWERRLRTAGGGWRVDLEPMGDLVERLGRPDRGLRVVHVTGSKGKGSVSSLIATALCRGGAAVGSYGSPHVESIRERVRLDGAPVDELAFAEAAEEALDAADAARAAGTAGAGASWFDVVTAAGLVAFRRAGVEWAVLEVGLGGRLDSTNVVEAPEACVVTTVELEHTAILGATRAAIAREKGGIFKAGAALVTGCAPGSEAGDVLVECARAVGERLVFAHDGADRTFEQRNVRVAGAVLGELRARGARPAELDGGTVAAARLPGRMEARRARGVDVVLDGAHVASSVALAAEEARSTRPGPWAAVVAIHVEKDPRALLAPLAEAGAARVYATTVPGSGVHRPPGEVAAAARAVGLEALESAEPRAALDGALAWAAGGAGAEHAPWVLVVGSLYVVGALRAATEPDRRPEDPSHSPGTNLKGDAAPGR